MCIEPEYQRHKTDPLQIVVRSVGFIILVVSIIIVIGHIING